MKVNVLSGDENSQKLLLQACVPFMDLKDNARFFIGKIQLKILINYVQVKKMSITKGR